MRHAGIGLRAPHYGALLERRPPLALLEVHSENFFGAGGPALEWLDRFRALYPVSLHGVGLSLGSIDPLDASHLERLAALARRVEPLRISEHLAWSSVDGRHLHDLLPLPFTREALGHVVARIQAVQERLGRAILVENVSSYVRFPESRLEEAQFVAEVARRSGCGILLDVNNVWVSAANHGFDARRYIDALDADAVGEYHLAGHEAVDGQLIDTHGTPVCEAVWALFRDVRERFGPRPTVLEWDTDLPALDVLLGEAARAESILAASGRPAERVA